LDTDLLAGLTVVATHNLPSPVARFFIALTADIVMLSACDSEGSQLFYTVGDRKRIMGVFKGWWSSPPVTRDGASFLAHIAEEALVFSKWVRAGENTLTRFLLKYLEGRLGIDEFPILLTAVPGIPEDKAMVATRELKRRYPRPIHSARWPLIKQQVLARFDMQGQNEQILTAAILAAKQARLANGILTPKGEMLSTFLKAYRTAAESGLEVSRPNSKPKKQKNKTDELSLYDGYTAVTRDRYRSATSIDGDSEERTDFERQYIFSEYSIRSAHMPMDRLLELRDLVRRFYRLNDEDRLTVEALYANALDYEATRRELRIENSTLRQRIHRIRNPGK
jgi:hypothetical protein